MTDVVALLGRGALLSTPFKKLDLECLFAGQAFECCDLRLIVLKKISRLGIFIERPSLELLDPNPDQSA